MPTDVSQPTTLAGGQREFAMVAPYVLLGDPTVTDGEGMLDVGQIPAAALSLGQSKQMASRIGPQQSAEHVWERGARPEVTLTLHDHQKRIIAAMFASAIVPDFAQTITAVSTTNDTVTVESDVTSFVSAGDVVTIDDSTANDGDYVIASLTYDSTAEETTITVEGSIADSTADGRVIGFQEGSLFRSGIRATDIPSLVVIPASKEENAIDKPGVYWLPGVTTTDAGDLSFSDGEGEAANEQTDFTLLGLEVAEDQAGDPIQKGARRVFSIPPWKLPETPLDWHLPDPYSTGSQIALDLG